MRTSPTPARLLAAGLAAAGLSVLISASPAFASGTTTTACWTDGDTQAVSCYPTRDAMIDAIETTTGGDFVAVPDGSASFAQPAPDTTFALVTVYDDLNLAGASMTYTTTNSAVCTGPSYGFSSLGSWNDRIESFQSFNGCVTTLYRDINYSPASPVFGPNTSSSNVGATWRNQASSLSVH
jgi:hypothetical protein